MPKKSKSPVAEVPAFLKPVPAPEPVKQKPGPKPGYRNPDNICPYCGGKAHRKAVQKLAGHKKAYRRMYCADGCGHYHYRDLDTNEVIADVGAGPRECRLHRPGTSEPSIEIELPFEQRIAAERSIGVESLTFTAKGESGRPRVIVNCLSEADIEALPTPEDRDNVQRLQRALLTIQACIGTYRTKR